MPARLRRGIGTSTDPDAERAGRAAAAEAMSGLDGAPVALVLVYSSIGYDLTALLASIRSVTGDVPLAGATSSGLLYNGLVSHPGRGVAVLVLSAGPYRFGVGAVTGVRESSFAAGQTLARTARAAAGGGQTPYSALLILADGLAVEHEVLLAGAHKVAGAAVPVVGGAAGDDNRLTETFVFVADRVLTDAAVGVWIGSPWPLTVSVAHGWSPAGLPMLVTKVDGTIVHEIAGRPAADIFRICYRDRHVFGAGAPNCRCPSCTGVREPDDPADNRQGHHSTHALGLIQPDGSLLIRGAFVDDQGHLNTLCPIPVYSAVQVVSATPDDLLEVADKIVPSVLDGREAGVVLLFSCVARWDLLGERGPEEAARLQAAAGGVATFGFYTYGEFARTTSVSGYHNATLTAVAL